MHLFNYLKTKSASCCDETAAVINRPCPLTIVTDVALVAVFIPTFYKLFAYGWKNADYSHGPLILAVFIWLLWKKRNVFAMQGSDAPQWGYLALFIVGLTLFAFGVTTRVMMFEAGALLPVLLGATGFLYGSKAFRMLLFPVTYLIFLVPPPLFLIDYITSPLKKLVSAVSVPVLSLLGYPASRNGVSLFVGDYSIIIGDACSGMRSLVSLLAIGALYVWPRKLSPARKTALLLTILPIAIAANIARLVLLALITYHIGDSAGQRFFHDYSGFFLFCFSLVALVVVDAVLSRGNPLEAPV